MDTITENPIFFLYIGFSAFVALFAFLWGGMHKLAGAGLLLGSIPVSNILFRLYMIDWLSIDQYSTSLITLDFLLAYLFFEIARRSNRLESNRWAAFISAIHIGMASVNIAGASYASFARTAEYHLILNILLIAAFLACLISFTPKSRREAIDILRMKWIYFRSDFFGIVSAFKMLGSGVLASVYEFGEKKKMIDTQIGSKLREARILRELSREDLAKALGVTVAQIQKYETGATRLSASALFALSQHLGVEVKYFYEGLTAAESKDSTKPATT